MTEIREAELLARLRALAAADEQRTTSPGLRKRVMRAWDERQDASLQPRRISLRVWLPLAASLTIVVGVMIGSIYQGPASEGSATATSAGVGRDNLETSILRVPNASMLPRFDHGELIRVEIPSPDGAIQAEVLVGQDGLARAIRVIQ
jgi:hypothetical protein